jgi:intracellular sulfur oxidation DsrE/DsrF family protein
MLVGLVSMPALAAGKGNTECPVGLVKDLTLDDEFGLGTSDITKCIKKRHRVKMVVQLNQYESGGRAYGLGNIANIIDDYEITHGMVRGRDYEIVAVVHSGGGPLVLQNGLTFHDSQSDKDVTTANKYQSDVEKLIVKGVWFLFCQNTTRAYLSSPKDANGVFQPARLPEPSEYVTADGATGATAMLIPGVEYTTAGLTSIADFQAQGYEYIQP